MAKLIKPSKYHRNLDGGELLRRMDKKGWTQEELADRTQITQQYISRLQSPGPDGDWHHEISVCVAEKFQRIF